MSKWVQHRSGQGEKWAVVDDTEPAYWICAAYKGIRPWLPRSEYRECEPPERWRDVTADCKPSEQESGRAALTHYGGHFNRVAVIDFGYRLRKVQLQREPETRGSPTPCVQWAFLVEKKEG